MNFRRAALSLMLVVLALPSSAQRIKDPQSPLDGLTFAKRELRVSQTLADADRVPEARFLRDAMSRFRAIHGRAWRFVVDQRTGRVNLIDGGAIPFLPGYANRQQSSTMMAECRSASCIPPARAETAAREFLRQNQAVLQVDPRELVADPDSVVPVGNSIYLIRLQWVYRNVRVEDASVFLIVNDGNLVQIGLKDIGPISLDPRPRVPLDTAWKTLRTHAGTHPGDQIVDSGTLVILPITRRGLDPDAVEVPFGKMIDYALVWKLAFRRPGTIGTWEGTVDAHTGELLRFRDRDVYGHIKGGVYKTDKPQTEVSMPFPLADHGAGTYADASGNFTGLNGTSTMSGPSAGGVRIVDGCGPISLAADAVGTIDFGSSGGTDCTTPGIGGAGNTHSARTQYWNIAQIKRKGLTYLPGNVWLNGQLQASVNISVFCNASWNGTTVNFYKSTGACNNTGELPGVSLHEWGHGMDFNDGSGGGNPPIETRADFTALLQTHQSCTGGGFFLAGNCAGYGDPCNACSGIRDADWAQHSSNTPWTPQNNGTVYNCGPGGYNGPCGWGDHCESGIATQALWDLVNRDLTGPLANMDIVSAWQLMDRLFYTGMPQSTNMYTCTGTTVKTSHGCGAGSLYNVLRAIDDDGDGTANGTPHAAAIFAALDRHAIACGVAADPANQNQTSCPPLTTPVVTATASSGTQIDLSWTSAGASATRYFVFRNETGCAAGFTKIATVNAPTLTYTDTDVAQGLTYYYRVQAATAQDSCVSAMSNCVTAAAQLPANRDFYVRDWTDTPSSHDLGEEPSTHYQTNWAWTSDVWNRGVNSPGTPTPNDWYPTDNMYAGLSSLGDNWGFVRVHRNAAGSSATVNAEFLVSEFGAGSNFAPVASTTLSFGAADTVQTAGAYWHQGPTASTHACIAVQISTPDDPYKSPSLAGQSPGQPGGQSLLLVDNNKAQRNLSVSLNVPHFAGIQYALIHNGTLASRDIVLRYETPASPRSLQGALIEVVGRRSTALRPEGTLVLDAMQPGENRWVAVKRTTTPDAATNVHFYEMDGDREVNAFTLQARPVSVAEAIRDNLRSHVQVFNRLAAAFGADLAGKEAAAATNLLRVKTTGAGEYLTFLREHGKPIQTILQPLIGKNAAGGAFGTAGSLSAMLNAVNKKDPQRAAAEHRMLLNRLDAFATMLQKADGDLADVLQMVRWQEQLYRMRPALARLGCSAEAVRLSQSFISAFDIRKPDAYVALMRTLSGCFSDTANVLANGPAVREAAAAMNRPGLSPAALQKAHREFLLLVQDAGAVTTAKCEVKVNGSVIRTVDATDRNDCYAKTSFGSENCRHYASFFKPGTNLLEQYFNGTDRVNSDHCTVCGDLDQTITTGQRGWTLVSGPGVTAPQTPTLVSAYPGWSSIPGADWISVNAAGGSKPGDYVYEYPFCLCATAKSPRLDLRLLADNRATVLLNGKRIFATTGDGNFKAPPKVVTYSGSISDWIIPGTNRLRIVVRNDSNVTGLSASLRLTAGAGACP